MGDINFLPDSIFKSPEHQPFDFSGYDPALLLIHGFPGSPAEMRPLGQAVHQGQWSVNGMLLPGFGPQINQLPNTTADDWISAAIENVTELKQRHRPVVVGGFSMGAAIALITAARVEVDGVILISPYWRLSSFLWEVLPLISLVFKQIKPFQLAKIDPQDPEVQAGIQEFMPDLDLQDPEVIQGMRQFSIPTSLFVQLREIGKIAKRQAQYLERKTLIFQGTRDRLVETRLTRSLMLDLPGPLHYVELDAEHDLLDPQRPAWPYILSETTNFLENLVTANGTGH